MDVRPVPRLREDKRGVSHLRFLHIAVGVVRNAAGEVLICQRPPHKLYPGEWEFPGGKVEPGETAEAALRRELTEELGIIVCRCRPLIRLRYRYPELAVELDTWLVESFTGEAQSTEHPAIAWVRPEALADWKLLAADKPIVAALRLPGQYVFTPPEAQAAWLLDQIAALPGHSLLRLRLPRLRDTEYERLAAELLLRCRQRHLRLMLDRDPDMVRRLGADGWHASAEKVRGLRERPVGDGIWFGASAHDRRELRLARAAGADFVVVGPVLRTASHPDQPGMGWEQFRALARNAGLPVYAIGGVNLAALPEAQAHGGQGVAGISGFWPTAEA